MKILGGRRVSTHGQFVACHCGMEYRLKVDTGPGEPLFAAHMCGAFKTDGKHVMA